MRTSLSAVAVCAAMFLSQAADAEIFTDSSMFSGDLCATDVDASGGLDDCATIAGNGGQRGLYNFVLTGLNPDPQGDVTIRLTSPNADLFADPGTNNPDERFRLLIEGVNFGRLFDGSEADEARVNAALAASVQQNILQSTGSASALDLRFSVPRVTIAPFLQDGELLVQLDFREDANINRFDDPMVSVSYEVQAAPDLASLQAEVFRLSGLVADQTAAIAALTQAVEALQNR